MLEIKNLYASTAGKDILKGIDLTLEPGKVHAIMGPNGSGKSTLSFVLAGHPSYDVTDGSITLNGASLLDMKTNERALAGIFLAFQYPMSIPGVKVGAFLQTVFQSRRRKQGLPNLKPKDFGQLLEDKRALLDIPEDMMSRYLNVGFSGGEKKRIEILQMALLEPAVAIMDETDSGLDIDALKLVARGVNALLGPDRTFLVITHYQRLLDYIIPDRVHIMVDGKVVESGDARLAKYVEAHGYDAWIKRQTPVQQQQSRSHARPIYRI